MSHPSRIDDRVRIGAELVALGRQLGRLAMTLGGRHALAVAHLERGELDAWRDEFERFTAVLGDHSLGFFQIQVINHRANRAYLEGDLAAAEAIAAETVPLSMGIGAGRVFAEWAIVASRRLQARDEELLARYGRAASRSSDAWYRCSLAAVQARSGQLDDARSTLDVLRDEGFPIRQIYPWSVAVSDLAEAAEVTGEAAGRRPRPAGRRAVLRPDRRRRPVPGPAVRPGARPSVVGRRRPSGRRGVRRAGGRPPAGSGGPRRSWPASWCSSPRAAVAPAPRASDVRPLVDEAIALAEDIGTGVVLVDIDRYGLLG